MYSVLCIFNIYVCVNVLKDLGDVFIIFYDNLWLLIMNR